MTPQEIAAFVIQCQNDDDIRAVSEALKLRRTQLNAQAAWTVYPGNHVEFNAGSRRGKRIGIVIEVKRLKASIKANDGLTWTVPCSMLTLVG